MYFPPNIHHCYAKMIQTFTLLVFIYIFARYITLRCVKNIFFVRDSLLYDRFPENGVRDEKPVFGAPLPSSGISAGQLKVQLKLELYRILIWPDTGFIK